MYIKIKKSFTVKQYGFISRLIFWLLNVLDKWSDAIDKGKSIDFIHADFMKAFDTHPR